MKRQIDIHYDLAQINLGDDTTSADVGTWLDNLATLIAKEFNAEVNLICGGTWGTYGECSHDADVNARLREISSGDEWIALLPKDNLGDWIEREIQSRFPDNLNIPIGQLRVRIAVLIDEVLLRVKETEK